MRRLRAAALCNSTIQDHLDGSVRRKALAEILIEVGIAAGDDKQVASHLLLGLDAGELPSIS
jgi:hypothetical protein